MWLEGRKNKGNLFAGDSPKVSISRRKIRVAELVIREDKSCPAWLCRL